MRPLILAVLGVMIFIGTGESAAKKKKAGNAPVTGKVFSVDEEKGSIRVLGTSRNRKKKEDFDTSFQIDPDTKIIINGREKKEYTGKEGLKLIKKDDMATIVLDGDFKTVSVTINPGRRK